MMQSRQRPTKAQRRVALAELLAGLPEPAELPPECDMAEASTTSEVSTAKEITIVQDGKTLHGSTWIKPQDYSEAEIEDNLLPGMKGVTPPEWPTLDADQVDQVDDG